VTRGLVSPNQPEHRAESESADLLRNFRVPCDDVPHGGCSAGVTLAGFNAAAGRVIHL
jgi:hypothetical protein